MSRTVQSRKKFNTTWHTRYTFPLRECTVYPVDMNLNGSDTDRTSPHAVDFLAQRFHLLSHVAVGARVLLTHNVILQKGVANGVPGIVEQITFSDKDPSHIQSIKVRITESGVLQSISRTIYKKTNTHLGRYGSHMYDAQGPVVCPFMLL